MDLVRASVMTMSVESVSAVRRLEEYTSALPQLDLHTDHLFHAGLYARTVKIPAGSVLTGAEIKIPTVVILCGHAIVTMGEGSQELCGYHVMPAAAGRKTAYLSIQDTWLTMLFPSEADSVEAAENEFTDEADRLLSRKQGD